MPPVVAANKICVLVGLMIKRRIKKLFVTWLVKPVALQVAPPLVDFKTPILLVSPASPSPVAKYMMLVLVGSMAKSEQPLTVSWSVLVVQLTPPLVLFQRPPAGVPRYQLFGLFGSISSGGLYAGGGVITQSVRPQELNINAVVDAISNMPAPVVAV